MAYLQLFAEVNCRPIHCLRTGSEHRLNQMIRTLITAGVYKCECGVRICRYRYRGRRDFLRDEGWQLRINGRLAIYLCGCYVPTFTANPNPSIKDPSWLAMSMTERADDG